MKKRFLPGSLLSVALALFMAAMVAIRVQAAEITPRQYNNLPVVILKIDDLKYYAQGSDAEQSWDRFLNYIRSKNLKANIGAIGQHFDKNTDSYSWFHEDVKTDFLKDSSIEIFNHSYCYCPDTFTEISPYSVQYDTLDRAQKAIISTLGVTPVAFGSGGNTKSADTIKVMNQHPQMKVWFFGDDNVDKSKVINLPRTWPLSNIDTIESTGVFLENFEKFRDRPSIVLQGHAGKWTVGQFSNFSNAIDALLKRYPKIKFMTVSEYYQYSGGQVGADIVESAAVPPSAPTNLIIEIDL